MIHVPKDLAASSLPGLHAHQPTQLSIGPGGRSGRATLRKMSIASLGDSYSARMTSEPSYDPRFDLPSFLGKLTQWFDPIMCEYAQRARCVGDQEQRLPNRTENAMTSEVSNS